ncbi:MAG: hypothetical protein FJX56_08690 [Alphaproteobacteria bacterium]|nr:hypothetical protein [Alphaproteobacteria bacterium]
MRGFIALVLASVIGAAAVHAEETPKLIGTYGDWQAYTYNEAGTPICYAASAPKDTKPTNVRRGDIYVLVTYRPAQRIVDEVSVYAGYPYATDSKAKATIGNNTFILFTEEETAWATDIAQDKAVAAAMVKGLTMVVRGTSRRGTTTTDTYSLAGFSQAREAVRKACE